MAMLCWLRVQKRKGKTMKTIKDCVFAFICGMGIGVWFGWFDHMGHIYYSVNDGIRVGAVLGGIFAIIALWDNLFNKGE